MDVNSLRMRKNPDIGSHSSFKKIFSYLNNNVKITNHNPIKISSQSDLKIIKENNYYIVPRWNGTYSWMVFTMINDCYYAVTFPKNNKYDGKQRLFPVDLRGKEVMYDGTIFDGIFYKNHEKNSRHFIVHDVYLLEGRNILNLNRLDRMTMLNGYLNINIQRNPSYDITACVNYFINNESISNLYNTSKMMETNIVSWMFYPHNSGHPTYYYNIQNNDFIIIQNKNRLFIMVKSKIPDVYHLYDLHGDKKNKIDIAYIPDITTSKKCASWFEDETELKVLCKNVDGKWIPLQVIDN